jgi:hypothetical protein
MYTMNELTFDEMACIEGGSCKRDTVGALLSAGIGTAGLIVMAITASNPVTLGLFAGTYVLGKIGFAYNIFSMSQSCSS